MIISLIKFKLKSHINNIRLLNGGLITLFKLGQFVRDTVIVFGCYL